MPTPFQKRITSSLDNPVLQSALDANADKRMAVRKQAFASLPDYDSRRLRAHIVRGDVISNLDVYLEKFIEKVKANGIEVHRASGVDEAVRAVLDIASHTKVRLVAKSKTMVSEEIHLNQALEEAGLQVVETDLGEYIVQLRNEAPSHIITPAVHLRRQEVGQTFHEKLGIPLTEDIEKMTEAARSVLRQVFLQAELGISGVNFGVVDTGTLCLMTNEGNGRMVTTLPPVHIALMGIERLVPNMEDLALMVSLLPRAATGQKITVYTSLINGPRQAGENEGPLQRHLILVDNGRSALREGPLSEILYCIRCGACLNACPIFREIGGHSYVGSGDQGSPYPGPMGSIVSPGLFGQAEFGHLARASTLCGACKDACPVDIDLPRLLLRVRAGKTEKAGPVDEENKNGNAPLGMRLGLRIYTWISTSRARFKLAVQSAGLLSRLISPLNHWMRLPSFTGWGFSKDFPRPSARPFRARWKDLKEEPMPVSPINERKDTLRSAEEEAEYSGNPPDSYPTAWNDTERFQRELEALGGEVIICSRENLPMKMSHFLKERKIQALQSWEEADLLPGLVEELRKDGISIVHQADADVPAGLTGAMAAIAETGSLLVVSGEGRPMSASLLPEIHLAVLNWRDIYPSFEALLSKPVETMAGKSPVDLIAASSAAVIISGPSRTADIEMTLTIGVHGPREVIVFCIED
jgi:L-lactate dehydrogenase complex protein LldF